VKLGKLRVIQEISPDLYRAEQIGTDTPVTGIVWPRIFECHQLSVVEFENEGQDKQKKVDKFQ
jgi:hypothetical protein